MDDGRSGGSGSSSKQKDKEVDKEVERLIKSVTSLNTAQDGPEQVRQKQAAALEKMGDVFEEATEDFFRQHPDPFDERAPHSIFPGCKLGLLQKSLSEYPEFLDKIVEEFIIGSVNFSVRRAACRLLLLTLPGFEVQPTFNSFGSRLVPKLETWSKLDLIEPLSVLSIGLLGLAMESSDIAGEHKNVNYQLVPKIIQKMQYLAMLIVPDMNSKTQPTEMRDEASSPPSKRSKLLLPMDEHESDSRSSFTSEIDIRPTHRMNPMTDKRRLTLLLQYLIPMAEYFEHLPAFIENGVLLTVLHLIKNGDSMIKLETLKLLSSLLCHNKVAIDFIQNNGLDIIIQVAKGSRAAAAVSVCLYYLAYNNDVMERLTQYPSYKLSRVVDYTLDLIETKHDSARVHGIMFFSYGLLNDSLNIIDYFDQSDGIRRLYNVLSTLKILQFDSTHIPDTHAEKTCAKMASVCILRYLIEHLMRLAEKCGVTTAKYTMGQTNKNFNLFELAKEINEHRNNDDTADHRSYSLDKFEPITRLIDLEAPRTLVRLAMHASDWAGFAGKLETMKALLQIVSVLAFNNKALLQLTSPVVSRQGVPDSDLIENQDEPEADNPKNTSLSLLIKLAEDTDDIDVHYTQQSIENIRKSSLFIIQKACCCAKTKHRDRIMKAVQAHHGIASLLRFLEQPGLRVYAANALAGMSRLDEIKQMLTRILRPEKLLGQALVEHPDRDDFRKSLDKLFSCTGSPVFQKILWDPDGPRKLQIVDATQIRYNNKELLQLIDAHLRENGYVKAAEQLRNEANIKPIKMRKESFKSPIVSTVKPLKESGPSQPGTSITRPNFKRYPRIAHLPTKIQFSRRSHSTQSPVVPRKIGLQNNKLLNDENCEIKTDLNVSLSKIVEFWLRDQHNQCRNPVLTVPEFSLFNRHKCPEPKPKSAPISAAARFRSRAHTPHWGGRNGKELDKKLIWSRYKNTSINIRTSTSAFATTSRLNTKENLLVLGCSNGDILMYNSSTDRHVAAYNCCGSPIINLEVKNDLILTTQRLHIKTTLWNFPDIEMKHDFDEQIVNWSCFANNSERIALTREKDSVLWDTATEKNLLILPFGDKGCGYINNRALFSPYDDQILSDGILWDLRSGKHIHRFDKLNKRISGLFNPYAPEVIINSEVWDLRTNRLLKIVPELNGNWPRFSPLGSVILSAAVYGDVQNRVWGHDHLGSNINILDTRSYNLLYNWKFESSKTKVPRQKIYDFCLKRDEEKINILESEWTVPDVISKWYTIGIMPDDEDSDQDDDQADDDEEGDNCSREYTESETEMHSDTEVSSIGLNFQRREDDEDEWGRQSWIADEERRSSGIQSHVDLNDDVPLNDVIEVENGEGDYYDENGQNVGEQEDADEWEDIEYF